MRNVALSLPTALVARVRERARQEHVSHPELLLDALTAAEAHLADLLADTAPATSSDGLFLRQAARPTSAPPRSIFSLRVLSPNLDTIDALVTRHQAASRSALCAAALEYYLRTPGQPQD